MKLTDVFKTQGKPTYTYVSPTSGQYENILKTAIENRGTLCLVTGPSKTGKTTLVTKVAEQESLELIKIRCDDELTADEFWRRALEAINFDRLSQKKNGGKSTTLAGVKLGGSIGWKWLAGLTGEVSLSQAGERSEEQVREKILAKPSPQHLIPVLRNLDALLVVEDFHYLSDSVKVTIFQQWKAFTDEEVSVVILGTTHHACDLAYSNKDLIGRISKIELTTWLKSDLIDIIKKGAAALNIDIPDTVQQHIADESVGLPIITQSICLEMLRKLGIQEQQSEKVVASMNNLGLYGVYNDVATSKYSQFELAYNRMIAGLRKRRRYKSYECMLGAFSLDPVVFRLKRTELCGRIANLPIPRSELPPEGSVKQALGLLNQLQEKVGVELLEWVERDDTLYIVEPTFLFYLRWRKARTETPNVLAALKDFLFNVEIDHSGNVKIIKVARKARPGSGR